MTAAAAIDYVRMTGEELQALVGKGGASRKHAQAEIDRRAAKRAAKRAERERS